jgi:hypothetical protein
MIRSLYRTRPWFRWTADVLLVAALVVAIFLGHLLFGGGLTLILNLVNMFRACAG